MPVDKTELAKELENPEFQKFVTDELSKKDFIIRTKADDTAYLDRFKNDVIEREIPTRVKAVHDQYDKDIKELYGDDRQQGEKTYDYLKRVATSRNQELEQSRTEIASLKEQIKGGDPTGALKKQLEEAERKYQGELKSWQDKYTQLESTVSKTERRAAISTVYAGIKSQFVKSLPPLFSRTEAAILSEIEANSIVKNGELYMTNPDGTIRKDNQFNEITVAAYLKSELKEVIDDASSKGGGAGSSGKGAGNGVDPATITADNFEMPASVKTGTDLMTYMLEIGLKRNTPVFNAIWAKHRPKLQ